MQRSPTADGLLPRVVKGLRLKIAYEWLKNKAVHGRIAAAM
jgi:hypothetical protein